MEENLVKIKKIVKRNEYNNGAVHLDITLPAADVKYIKQWAAAYGITVSRAIHDAIWSAYHAEKGDYKPYQ
jgi:hypothetical protein